MFKVLFQSFGVSNGLQKTSCAVGNYWLFFDKNFYEKAVCKNINITLKIIISEIFYLQVGINTC